MRQLKGRIAIRSKTSPSEYLACLSAKYEVDADEFFDALVLAGTDKKSTCGTLAIECRGEKANGIILLITKGPKVVAQFSVTREFLLEENNPIRDYGNSMDYRNRLAKRDSGVASTKIGDLQVGMKSVSLSGRVLEISKSTFVVTRFGNHAKVASAMISDDTGKIKLCLWNEQIGSVTVGDTVQVENARISTFRGEKQLRVGKKGVLRVCRDVTVD
jgi:replication factor A1